MIPRAWVLNLDAEDELLRGHPSTPSRVERARIEAMTSRLRGTLVPQGDVIVWPGGDPVAAGARGRAWCPTPGALARLRAVGATVPSAPTVGVIRAVNHRAWAASRGLHLPGARWLPDPDAFARHMEAPWPSGGWLLKRPLGHAGRGRLHLRARRELDDRRHAGWVRNAFAEDGLLAEPFVARALDLGLHGWLAPGGALSVGALTRQVCDDRGAWVETRLCEEGALSRSEIGLIEEIFLDTARGLSEAGYHGPFGVDAFVWRDDAGARRLQPRSEVNARYSMGWAVGMAATRPDLSCP